MRISMIAVAAGLAVALADRGGARTWSVPGDFAEIQDAIDAAQSDDVVLVQPGRYAGNVRIRDKDVVLRSAGGAAVTILEGFDGWTVELGGGGELEGFTVTNRSANVGGAISCFGAGPIVRRNVIEGSREAPGGFNPGLSGPTTDALIEGNVFRNNTCFQFALVELFNLGFGEIGPPRVQNNLFIDNDCVVLASGGPLLVANNTFVGNRAGFRERYTSPQIVLRNNLFTANDIGIDLVLYLNGEPRLEHNLVFGNAIDYADWVPPPSGANLSADPLLVDLAGRDLRLRPGSPAVDAGLAIEAPPLDFAGLPRPLDGDGDGVAEVDIGAYELAPEGFPSPTPTASVPPAVPTRTPTQPASPFGPFPPGTTIFVAAANSGAADGSALHPFRSIQEAIDAASGPAAVGVAAGTYREAIEMRRAVDVRGAGAATTAIDAGASGPAVRCADQAALEGFTITNAAGRDGAAVFCGPGVRATLARNRVVDNDSIGVGINGATVEMVENEVEAEPEFTRNCPCDAVAVANGDVEIRRNILRAEGSNVSAIGLSDSRYAIVANRIVGRVFVRGSAPLASSRIANNLIVSGNGFSEAINLAFVPAPVAISYNTLVGGGGLLLQGGSTAEVLGNIIAFGTVGVTALGVSPGLVLRHNLVFGNGMLGQPQNYHGIPDPTGTEGNLSSDPLFADRAAGDFRIGCRSPAIDAGASTPLTDDLDGQARPFDGDGDGVALPDIGADEYVATRPVTTLHVPGDFARLQDALDASLPCDRIRVFPGTYDGPLRFNGTDVTVYGVAGAQETFIDGGGATAVEIGPGGRLQGFTVRGGAVVRGAETQLLHNIFEGGGGYGGMLLNAASALIDANLVRGSRCGAATPPGAITIAGGAPRLRNNVIANNECAGISGAGAASLVHNTVADNRVGIDWDAGGQLTLVSAVNNVIARNQTGLRVGAEFLGEDRRWRSNLFFANDRHFDGLDPLTDRNGNVVANPRFVDAGRANYRLQADSVAIDAAAALDNAPPADHDGLLRPFDGDGDGTALSDLGAHEFGASAPCAGDCDADRRVTIDELILGVSITLGERALAACGAFDTDLDGRPSIEELVRAVGAALRGC